MGYLINGAAKANIFSCENGAGTCFTAFKGTFPKKDFHRKIIAIETIGQDLLVSKAISCFSCSTNKLR